MANITNLKTWLVVSIFLVVLGVQAAAGRTIYVTTTGNNVRGKGSSGSPYRTIQKGIDSAVDGDTVLVADGTYTGDGNRDLDFNGKAITVTSENGAEATIIDCQGREEEPHRGFYFHSGETLSSVIDGFTIKNGYGPVEPFSSSTFSVGGGIYCTNSSPTITNNIITGNTAEYGGGIQCWEYSSPRVTNNVITRNSSSQGAGIWCYKYCSATISNNTITENVAGWSGGGVKIDMFSSAEVVNNVIAENSAQWKGGGIYCGNSSPMIINNTIAANSSQLEGGGAYIWGNASPIIVNTILWGDSPEEIVLGGGGSITITYSCVQGGWPGEGNIDADPLFVDAGNADYHLQASSPCIDAGDNSAIRQSVVVDPDGSPRIINGIVDMGAYEHETTWISVSGGQIDQRNLPPWTGGWTTAHGRKQSFTPDLPILMAIDIILVTANHRGGSTLTLEISQGDQVLTTVSQWFFDGYEGLAHFSLPEPIVVSTTESVLISLFDSPTDTLGWKYSGNSYDRGVAYFSGLPREDRDFFFRTWGAAETIPPKSLVEDFESNNFSTFPWEHHGDASWTITSYEKHSGTYSAQAGAIDHDERATLRVRVDCISGDITFYRKVSSEAGCDYLEFYIDGVEEGDWSGTWDWDQVSFPVRAGTRTFEWTYSKDGSISSDWDTAWIDDIVFPIGADTIPTGEIIELADATFNQTVLSSDVPVLVDFWAPWCGPCLTMAPVIEEIADEYAGKIKVCKLNVDNAPGTTTNYGIRFIPTFILFKDGQVQRQWVGVTNKNELTSAIDELL